MTAWQPCWKTRRGRGRYSWTERPRPCEVTWSFYYCSAWSSTRCRNCHTTVQGAVWKREGSNWGQQESLFLHPSIRATSHHSVLFKLLYRALSSLWDGAPVTQAGSRKHVLVILKPQRKFYYHVSMSVPSPPSEGVGGASNLKQFLPLHYRQLSR